MSAGVPTNPPVKPVGRQNLFAQNLEWVVLHLCVCVCDRDNEREREIGRKTTRERQIMCVRLPPKAPSRTFW